MVVDMLSLRAAAEKPPVSTTRLNTSRLVNRSIPRDYPLSVDNRKEFSRIIDQIIRTVSRGALAAIARQTRQSLWGSHGSVSLDHHNQGHASDYPPLMDNPSGISSIIARTKKTDSLSKPTGDRNV
jgi:hypothetical protein